VRPAQVSPCESACPASCEDGVITTAMPSRRGRPHPLGVHRPNPDKRSRLEPIMLEADRRARARARRSARHRDGSAS
jgi:hypothetical protein